MLNWTENDTHRIAIIRDPASFDHTTMTKPDPASKVEHLEADFPSGKRKTVAIAYHKGLRPEWIEAQAASAAKVFSGKPVRT